MQTPVFTIVTPSFQQMKWLKCCVASVNDQKQAYLEHLICDGGSPDADWAWLQTYPGTRCTVQPDNGMYEAINNGLRRAQGHICAYLNCDEQYFPDTLRTVLDYFNSHPKIDLLFGDAIVVDTRLNPLAYRKAIMPNIGHIKKRHLNTFSSSMFFRHTLIEQGMFFNERWKTVGDADWVLRCLESGFQVGILNRPLSVFCITGVNLGSSTVAKSESVLFQGIYSDRNRLGIFSSTFFHWVKKLIQGAYLPRVVSLAVYTPYKLDQRTLIPTKVVGPFWPKSAQTDQNSGRAIRSLIQSIIPRFRKAASQMDELRTHETWCKNQIKDYQMERLKSVWNSAQLTHYFKSIQSESKIPVSIQSLEELSDIPIMTKRTLQQVYAKLLSINHTRGAWMRTGGSTGLPTSVFWSHEAHQSSLRCQYRFRDLWGVQLFDRTVFLWGHSASFAPGIRGAIARLKQPVIDSLRNRIRLSAYDLSTKSLDRYIEKIHKFQPKLIYSYSSAAYVFALHCLSRGFVPKNLAVVMLTAEPATPEMIRVIESAWKVPAVREYGSVDCGFLAFEDRDRRLRVREDRVILETESADNGLYRILVTVLDNPDFPLIRYEIGDMTSAPLERPEKGFAILKDVIGRTNDFLIRRDGASIHPEAVTHAIKSLDLPIRRFSATQAIDGQLQILCETDLMPDTARAHIQSLLSKLLGGFPVYIQVVDLIPPNRAGKHRWIESHYNPITHV